MWRPFLLLIVVAAAYTPGDYFQIKIVDEQTGRGVPLVELRTTNNISCWTDSNGIVAWNEPGLMNRPVYFSIQSPGYIFPGGGTFTCTRPPAEGWRDSSSLILLYFYDGKYTTASKPGAQPIARVWRNPASKLILDREAAAVW
jgi:hypothetical protein